MKNTINYKDFKKISKSNKNLETCKKSKSRNYYDRLNDAIEYGFSFKKDTLLSKEDSLVLKFEGTQLLSHNDILRINFKSMYKYIKLWKDRVKNLVSKEEYSNYFSSKPVKIEFLVIHNKDRKLDYDASVACTKFIIDGIIESKIIKDDTTEFIPIILTNQKVDKNKEHSSIYVILTKIEESELNNYYSDELKDLF